MALSNVESEWLETTAGERFKIQTSSRDTGGECLKLELQAAPRIGVPVHTHDNEGAYFIIVEGTVQIAVAGKTQDFPAGTSVTSASASPMLGVI